MADNIAVTAGSGETIAFDDISGVKHQRVKISQGADGVAADVSSAAPLQVTLANTGANTNKLLVTPDLPTGAATAAKQPALGTAGSSSTDVISVQGIASGTAMPISVATIPSHAVTNAGTFAVQAAQSGTWTVQPGNTANTTAWKVDGSAVTQPVSGTVTANAGSGFNANGQTTMASSAPVALASDQTWGVGSVGFTKLEDAASVDGDKGVPTLVVRKATPANTSGTDGDYEFLQESGGYLWVHDNKGLSNKVFSTTFATLTRPANTTAYTAADSISDNATAGSVTALVSGNISDVNDDPIFISEIHINSTDTGLAGKKIRAYLFNSDPTSSSGVSGGDNAAYAQKKAGYLGSFMGWLETGFSDGTVGRLVPTYNETNFTQAGSFIPALPVSGARTLYIQYQAVEAFTPSANSTTIIGTAKGWQGRAV